MNFAAGYGLALSQWVQLFYVCELGENIQDNGFGELLYGVEWEILPTDIQMVIMLIINRNQNGLGLKFGPFGKINRKSFKMVYTLHIAFN